MDMSGVVGNVFGKPRKVPVTWFSHLFGFSEFDVDVGVSLDRVRSNVEFNNVDGIMKCPNGLEFQVGQFSLPSVQELRAQLVSVDSSSSSSSSKSDSVLLSFSHIVGDAKVLHLDPINSGAVFQAASQFNCLEMPKSTTTPEDGINDYISDRTQGPACALACAAGTFYRNYLVPGSLLTGATDSTVICERGQSYDCQINTMAEIEQMLSNRVNRYWTMRNGYLLPTADDSLEKLSSRLDSDLKRDTLMAQLRVGVQANTQVTPIPSSGSGSERGSGENCFVTQVYASAVPVGYDSKTPRVSPQGVSREDLWMPLALLVLMGTYEATIAVAALQAKVTGKRVTCFLTKVGGGVFQNKNEWIVQAIQRALDIHKHANVHVKLVHFSGLERGYQSLAVH